MGVVLLWFLFLCFFLFLCLVFVKIYLSLPRLCLNVQLTTTGIINTFTYILSSLTVNKLYFSLYTFYFIAHDADFIIDMLLLFIY